MSGKEAQEWEMYNLINPFPEDKIINALGHIATIMANAFLKRTDHKKWERKDFIPEYFTEIKKSKKQNPKDLKKGALAFASRINNAFNRKPKKEEKKKTKKHVYALEKLIKMRTSPPIRLQNKKGRK